jgi:hypothetical protein
VPPHEEVMILRFFFRDFPLRALNSIWFHMVIFVYFWEMLI